MSGSKVDTCTGNSLWSEPHKGIGTEAVIHVIPVEHSTT